MDFLPSLNEYLRKTRLTRRGASPKKQFVRYAHKEYPRMERIPLPEPNVPLPPLDELLRSRTSPESPPDVASPLSLADIGTIFGHALGMRQKSDLRAYPSGGRLYPVESYLISSAFKDHHGGIFHYHPREHALEYLWEMPAEVTLPDVIAKRPPPAAGALLIFTSVWERSAIKYGHLTYMHALLEAGHMSQNVLLAATALGISCRPMAGFDDALVTSLLDLRENDEQGIHSIMLYRE